MFKKYYRLYGLLEVDWKSIHCLNHNFMRKIYSHSHMRTWQHWENLYYLHKHFVLLSNQCTKKRKHVTQDFFWCSRALAVSWKSLMQIENGPIVSMLRSPYIYFFLQFQQITFPIHEISNNKTHKNLCRVSVSQSISSLQTSRGTTLTRIK